MSYRLANPVSRIGLYRWLAPLVAKFPQVYLGGLSVLAVMGYTLLFGAPLLALASLQQITIRLLSLSDGVRAEDYMALGLWVVVGLYSGVLVWKLSRMKLPLPQGLMIKDENFPALQSLLQNLHDHFQVEPITRVAITEHFELRMRYTPRQGLPLASTPTLCIGLPVLQCLSAKHFGCLLAGQMGLHAAPYSRWLYHLTRAQQLFEVYGHAFRDSPSLLILPLRLLFSIYQPVYRGAAVFAGQQSQLEADHYSLEIYSDSDLHDSIATATACQKFLHQYYWPEVLRQLQHQAPQQVAPHLRMSEVMRRALAGSKALALLQETFNTERDDFRPTVALQRRMANIGYNKLSTLVPPSHNAAEELLGSGAKKIIDFMDKLWMNRHLADWKKQQDRRQQKQALLDKLAGLAQKRPLSTDELWKRARLTEKLHGEAAAIPLYQGLLKSDAHHANGLFAYGSILLQRGEVTGVRMLEQAMQLKASLTPQACALLFKFYLKNNQKQQAMLYRNRGLSFSQQNAA
ncbi:MAG: hypothetical protein R6X06_07705 [Gammaproteobacteria bacterium]